MLRVYTFVFVLIPFLVAAASMLVAALIPGCRIDEGAGAQGCGAMSPLLEAGSLGGFAIFVCGLMGLFPVALLHGLMRWLTPKDVAAETVPVTANAVDQAVLEALTQYRDRGVVGVTCPACASFITVTPAQNQSTPGQRTLKTQCDCGRCKGRFNMRA